jgi:hypothetical protein
MDQIDSYLADLGHLLRVAPRTRDRLVAEIGEHLRDAAAEGRAGGLDEDSSTQRAIARLGSPREVAAAANSHTSIGALAFAAAQLVSVGCVAVILGTLLARALARVTSTMWVFGLPADTAPARSNVAHWLQLHPGSQGWRQAAAEENASDSLVLRCGFAVLLLAVAVVFLVLARHRVGRLADETMWIVGLVMFGVAAMLLVLGGFAGLDQLDWGRGQWFSDAAIGLVMAATFGAQRARHRGESVAP